MAYNKVIIIGGGFAGLNAAKKLNKNGKRFDVLLIDKTNHHLFQPLLYEVATAAISPGGIAVPIREIVRNNEHMTVIMGDVVTIDRLAKHVVLHNGDRFHYDYLIAAPGARHSYFGNDSWEAFAPGLKTISDAIKLREQILISFEIAERLDSISKAAKYLNFIVIGGGPTGVEMAGAIAEIAFKTLFKNFRRIKPERSKIYLIEATPRILPTYPEKLSHSAQKQLEDLGVHVMTGKRVTNVSQEGVWVEGRLMECKNIIWAAGNQASPILATLDVPLDRQGRVLVEPDLSIPGDPHVFVIGDAACALGIDGKPLPGIAPTAIQQGKYVAKIIRKGVPKENRPPFRYVDKGFMATIGKGKAVAVIGKMQLAGFTAWCIWCFVHILYLIGFRNRFAVMIEWATIFLTGQRGVRLIYRSVEWDVPKQHG